MRGYKDIQQIQKDNSLKKFLESLNLFSQHKFSDGRIYQSRIKLAYDVTGMVNII